MLVLATRSPPGSSCCQADSYDQFVRLFTPLSPEKAGQLERGGPLDEPLYWTDRPAPEEATKYAIWMVLTIPYQDLPAAVEKPGLGYREWELPPEFPATCTVKRLDPADC